MFSSEALRSFSIVRHFLDFTAHGSSSHLLTEAAANDPDVRVLVHDASDKVHEGRDPADLVRVVDGMAAAWEDDGFEGLEVVLRGKLVLEGVEELPLLIASLHQLPHEESLVNVGPVWCIIA